MVGLIIVVLLAFGYLPSLTASVAPSCTVGYAGTDMNITVDGWGSGAKCQSLIAHSRPDSGGPPNAYLSKPSGTLMCQYPIKGNGYTVRDSGILKVYGNQWCASFQSWYNDPSTFYL